MDLMFEACKPLIALVIAWVLQSGMVTFFVQVIKDAVRGLAGVKALSWLYVDGRGSWLVSVVIGAFFVHFFGADVVSSTKFAENFTLLAGESASDALEMINWAIIVLGSNVGFKALKSSLPSDAAAPARR